MYLRYKETQQDRRESDKGDMRVDKTEIYFSLSHLALDWALVFYP